MGDKKRQPELKIMKARENVHLQSPFANGAVSRARHASDAPVAIRVSVVALQNSVRLH